MRTTTSTRSATTAPARSPAPPSASGSSARRTLVRRRHVGQGALLLASATLAVASFLPWVDTAFGSFSGMAGAGVYTFYAAVWGVAGGLVPWRRVALAHAVAVTAVAIALPAWQISSLMGRGLDGGWAPGTGIMLALASGSLAARAVWQLAHRR
ncbi:hypothetical protein BH23ACT9_BH23ACT9_03930 [soil metagenome]